MSEEEQVPGGAGEEGEEAECAPGRTEPRGKTAAASVTTRNSQSGDQNKASPRPPVLRPERDWGARGEGVPQRRKACRKGACTPLWNAIPGPAKSPAFRGRGLTQEQGWDALCVAHWGTSPRSPSGPSTTANRPGQGPVTQE